MRRYQVDDFIADATNDPINVTIDKKVSLLYDLCILCKNKSARDTREVALRKVLSQYTSEKELTTVLHDVVFGNKSVDTFLAQKGEM